MTLETIPLFQHLSPGEFDTLRPIVQERQVSSGREIFHEGDPGDGVFFVKEGLVEISAVAGSRRIFSQLGPGEIFGEMAVIEQQPRSATASAAQDTTVFFVPRERMLDFIEKSPHFAFALLQQISHRLREFNQRHLQEILESERLAAIGDFARGVVHDLKNPLHVIALAMEVLSNSNLNAPLRADIQTRAGRQVRRINGLVSDILTFTDHRHDTGFQSRNFPEFVRQLADEMKEELAEKSVQFKVENNPPPVSLTFNPGRLGRVFQNLAQNAVEFMEDGGMIFLRFRSGPEEILVELEDTGPGIAPEIAAKLFQPFATHGKLRGTGLGLLICKKIVEDHGGKISAHSKSGRGAIFRFTLPLTR